MRVARLARAHLLSHALPRSFTMKRKAGAGSAASSSSGSGAETSNTSAPSAIAPPAEPPSKQVRVGTAKRRTVKLAYDEDDEKSASASSSSSSSSSAPPEPPALVAPPELIAAVAAFSHSIKPSTAAAAAGASSSSSSSSALPPPENPPGSPARGFGKAIRPSDRWTAQLANIVKMREKRTAAVDSMGCERCSDTTAPLPVQRFQTLVSLMLSSQTKDEVTYAAVQRLITGLEGSLTPQALRAADEETVGKLIYPVGFWRNKARFLKLAAEDCLDKFGGDIPSTLEGLCSLKGVGPKMAFIALNAAWDKPIGIGVDTHVHRIANRLGWVRTTEPEATRDHLQGWLPRGMWGGINVLLVGFGQSICTPIGPKCDGCLNRDICPVGTGHKKA
jgi:endonuclease III